MYANSFAYTYLFVCIHIIQFYVCILGHSLWCVDSCPVNHFYDHKKNARPKKFESRTAFLAAEGVTLFIDTY